MLLYLHCLADSQEFGSCWKLLHELFKTESVAFDNSLVLQGMSNLVLWCERLL